jgi:hypothetical protein
MERMDEVKLFCHLGSYNEFTSWLKAQHEDAVKYLVEGREPVVIHRAQGKILFIEEMMKLANKSRNLRQS